MIDMYPAKVAVSVVIYCLSVSAVPIYNKMVFSGGVHAHHGGLTKFPYPVATAFLQLGLVSVVLGLINVLGHVASCCCGRSESSWLFGPHFAYKLYHVAPVGLLFGFKYGLTNWGLQLLPTGEHLLLQSTDLIWTVVTARVWNKEKLGVFETVAVIFCTIGSVMIGLHAGQTVEAPLLPLLVNCLTPLLLAGCISTLRSGAKELFRADNRLQGTVTPTEFTSMKLFLSASMALLFSFVMENGTLNLRNNPAGPPPAWWVALQDQSEEGVLFLLLGGVFVLIFQVNITWLSGLTSAVTVGIVGGVKVVPQWLLNAAFLGMHINAGVLNLGGAILVLLASSLYTIIISQPHRLVFRRAGFEWEPRFTEPLLLRGTTPEDSNSVLQDNSKKDSLVTHSAHLEVSVFTSTQ